MTTHAYHRTKRQRIGNIITALLTFVLVASNVLLPRAVYGNTAESHEVVLSAGAPENHLLTSARALELPASNGTYAPPTQDEPFDVPVAAENLVSKWSGEENARDLVGTNHGDMRNGAGFTAGKIGQSFSFDGIDDYISASGGGIDDLQELTIAAWVQMDSLPPDKIARFVSLGGAKAVLRYDGINGPRQLHFYMNINGELHHIRVNNIIEAGSFHHVAGTYDGRTMTLYWDGAEVGSLEVQGTVARGDGVDLSSEGEALDGALDEVAIYDRALSATEITELFGAKSIHSPTTVAAENLVSKWSGDGNALDLMDTNNGELRNGAGFTTGKIGQSFHFDGIDDYISANGNGINDLQEFTIAAWVQLDSLIPGVYSRFVTLGGEKAVLRYDGYDSPHEYLNFYMNIEDEPELQHIRVDDIIEPGAFHHVAGTYDGNHMVLYWDGAEVGSLEVQGTVAEGNGVALSSPGEPLNGALDEVAIYNRALSATEIAELFGAKSILSPAAYLIYLLDFVSRSIEPLPNTSAPALDSLAGLRTLFKQDFGALLASEANDDPVSYVECTNVILETLIAEHDDFITELARPPIPQEPDPSIPGARPPIPQEPDLDAPGAKPPIQMGPAVESAETNPFATEQPTPVPMVIAANAEAVNTQPGTKRSRCGSPVNPTLLDAMYAQFQSVENPAVSFPANRNNAFGPQLFVDLFDAFVQELDTTRAQVRLVMSGTETLQNSLVDDLHLPNRAALQQINLADATIAGTGYSSIVALQDLLWDVKWTEAEAATRGEQQADLRDSMYRQFRTDYRAFQQDEIARVLQELIQSIDANSTTRDQELAQKQTDARTCVLQGEACPSDSTYNQNPLRMLPKLLEHESPYLVPESDRSYMFSLEGSLGGLNQAAQEELIVSEFFTQGISITAPITMNVIDSNQWAVVADTNEYRIEENDNLYNVYRYCGGTAPVEQVLCLRKDELTTQRFQELREEFPTERQKEQLRKEALDYAEERLWSQDEFERQLEKLAKVKYEREFAGPLPDDLQQAAQALAQQEWQASVDQAEAGYQTKLRADLLALLKRNLSDLSIPVGESFEEALANKLLLDLFMDESQVTTPLAFAIGRLHTLVQGARLGSDMRYRPVENFDETAWSVLSSYGIFHAAMTVSNYPESFLFPELRQNKSSLFASAMISVTQGVNVNQVYEEYAQKLDQLRHLQLDAVVPADDKIFIFAHNDYAYWHNGYYRGHYYSVISPDGQWKDWKPLPGSNSAESQSSFAYPATDRSRPPYPYLSKTIGYVDGYIVFFGLVTSYTGIESCSEKVAYSRLLVDGDKLLTASSDDAGWIVSDIDFGCPENVNDVSFTIGDDGIGEAYLVYKENDNEYSILGTTFLIDVQQNKLITTTVFPVPNLSVSELYPVSNSLFCLWQVDEEKIAIGNPSASPDYTFGVEVSDVVASEYRKPGAAGYSSIDTLYRESDSLKRLDFLVLGSSIWREGESVAIPISNTNSLVPKAIARIDDDKIFGFFELEVEGGQALYYADLSERKPMPIRISLPYHPLADFTEPHDQHYALPWLEDYYLHFPIMVANYLMENQRYDEALEWLSEVYDPFATDKEQRVVYPAFHPTPGASDSGGDTSLAWLQDPFTPYLIADQNPSHYLRNTQLTHVENLLGWADALYTMDTVESVNRARELYEGAAYVLQSLDTAEMTCGIQEWTRFGIAGGQPQALSSVWGELTSTRSSFCLPSNPLANILRWRIEANLFKIHTNRNFAGLQRNMPFYATPLDPGVLVRAGGVGTAAFNQSAAAGPPPVYRYSFLLDRARYLTNIAQQFETSMLSAIKEEDAETYTYMRAKQDLHLEQANVALQSLRQKEAQDMKSQALEQIARAETQYNHFDELIGDGLLSGEVAALAYMVLSTYLPTSVGTGMNAGVSYSPSGLVQTEANIVSTIASYERREQEWEFQRDLANHDKSLAKIGSDMADDHIAIVNQEHNIANQRLDFATDAVEYLADEKFTNADLYRWMNQHLRQLYRDQLNMAIATAKSAERVLEFERQTSLDFIGNDYWEDEKRGLLGSEQLLQDIEKMEQYRLTTATRRKEIEKTISLASVAPAEFQRFKQTGVLEFSTLPQWFERDFPGYYLRLIKDVRVNLVAIVPATDGIHATLSNNGISRVMAGPPFEERTVIYRQPESVAISSPNNATGLFELNPNDPMLFPFEGSGVDTSWTFQMDKGANRFNYDTIYDLLFTIRYTALEDTVYRKKVLEGMGQDVEGYVTTESVRFFSLANEFVDEWYGFHNPVLGLDKDEYFNPFGCDASNCPTFAKLGKGALHPYTMVLDLAEGDFPYNEEQIKVKSVTLAIQRAVDDQNAPSSINFQLKLVPNLGSAAEANLNFAEGETVKSATAMGNNRPRPFGRWILQLSEEPPDNEDLSWLKDILLIVEYEAKVHYN